MTTMFEIKPEDVLELAAQKLADEVGCAITIKEMVSDKIDKRIKEAMDERVNQKIDGLLTEALDRVLNQTIQPVDIWGETTGEPTTIKDSFSKKARDFWNEKVDKAGLPVKPDSWGYREAKTRAEFMIGRILQDEFVVLVKQNAVNILATFKEKMREDTHKAIDKHLDELIKVKSR